jgi:hypothetical protein
MKPRCINHCPAGGEKSIECCRLKSVFFGKLKQIRCTGARRLPFGTLGYGIASREQAVISEPEPALFDLIDTQGADRQLSCVKALHPVLGLHIPHMKLYQFERLAEQSSHIVISQSRVLRVAPALNIQNREQTLADCSVGAESGSVAGLRRELPLAVPVFLVLDVVTGTGLRVGGVR